MFEAKVLYLVNLLVVNVLIVRVTNSKPQNGSFVLVECRHVLLKQIWSKMSNKPVWNKSTKFSLSFKVFDHNEAIENETVVGAHTIKLVDYFKANSPAFDGNVKLSNQGEIEIKIDCQHRRCCNIMQQYHHLSLELFKDESIWSYRNCQKRKDIVHYIYWVKQIL